jgi:hypothetical protein
MSLITATLAVDATPFIVFCNTNYPVAGIIELRFNYAPSAPAILSNSVNVSL